MVSVLGVQLQSDDISWQRMSSKKEQKTLPQSFTVLALNFAASKLTRTSLWTPPLPVPGPDCDLDPFLFDRPATATGALEPRKPPSFPSKKLLSSSHSCPRCSTSSCICLLVGSLCSIVFWCDTLRSLYATSDFSSKDGTHKIQTCIELQQARNQWYLCAVAKINEFELMSIDPSTFTC